MLKEIRDETYRKPSFEIEAKLNVYELDLSNTQCVIAFTLYARSTDCPEREKCMRYGVRTSHTSPKKTSEDKMLHSDRKNKWLQQ